MNQAGQGRALSRLARGGRRFRDRQRLGRRFGARLAGAGFVALATSSGATAGVLGRRDGAVSRDEAMASARAMAERLRFAGLGRPRKRLRPRCADGRRDHRTRRAGRARGRLDRRLQRRCRAAAATRWRRRCNASRRRCRRRGRCLWPFTLTARCENFLRGNPNLDDTIARLQAFERAGADVLMAPGQREGPRQRPRGLRCPPRCVVPRAPAGTAAMRHRRCLIFDRTATSPACAAQRMVSITACASWPPFSGAGHR